jgi:NAD(P)H-flavin reductase
MKIYDDPHPGKLSSWMDKQPIGSKVEFKHVEKDIKLQYPFFGSSGKTGHNVADSITMICGGTGITPMYQALQAVLNYPGDKTQIVLIYGNRTLRDILLKDELDQLETDSNGQLKVVHVIGSKDTTKGSIPEWDGEVGHVSKHHVEKYAHSPKSSTLVFLCGVPGMYETMCGPRTEDELKPGTVLDQLGFKTRQIYKF